jgi:hypothetical protein
MSDLRKVNDLRTSLQQDRDAFTQSSEAEKTRIAQEQQRFIGMPAEMLAAEGQVAAIQQEYASVDWGQLEATDPGRAALEKQKFNDRLNQAAYKRDMARQRVNDAQNHAQAETLERERTRMLEEMPEWRDESKFSEARSGIVGHMSKYGITEAEVMGIADHRVLKMIYDAATQSSAVKGANAARKRATDAPKVIRSGAVKATLSGKNATFQKLAKRAKATKKPDDVKRAAVALLQSKGVV